LSLDLGLLPLDLGLLSLDLGLLSLDLGLLPLDLGLLPLDLGSLLLDLGFLLLDLWRGRILLLLLVARGGPNEHGDHQQKQKCKPLPQDILTSFA
jgi:hypothetical protein